jgi:hypothetical protein
MQDGLDCSAGWAVSGWVLFLLVKHCRYCTTPAAACKPYPWPFSCLPRSIVGEKGNSGDRCNSMKFVKCQVKVQGELIETVVK